MEKTGTATGYVFKEDTIGNRKVLPDVDSPFGRRMVRHYDTEDGPPPEIGAWGCSTGSGIISLVGKCRNVETSQCNVGERHPLGQK